MKIVPTQEKYIPSFRETLDAVAKERKYLLLLEAPELEKMKSFIKSLPETGGYQYYALDGETVVGWCDVQVKADESICHTGKIGMGVRIDYRGKGLGRQLLQTCIDHGWNAGLTRLELEVFASNSRALALYEKLGFVKEGVKHKARIIDGKHEDIVMMALLRNW